MYCNRILSCFFSLIIILLSGIFAFSQISNERMPETEGSVQYRKGNYSRAAELFQQAIASDPGRASAYNNLGTAFAMLGRFDDAIDSFKRAVSVEPNFEAALTNLGVAYDKANKPEQAVDAFLRVIVLNPKSIGGYVGLCENYLRSAQGENAVNCYEKLFVLNPADELTLANYGYALVKIHQDAKAVEVLQSVLKDFPPHGETLQTLGIALFELGRFKDAGASFRNALGMNPADDRLRYNLAIAALSAKDRNAAIEQYAQLKKANSEFAEQLYQNIFRGKLLVLASKETK